MSINGKKSNKTQLLKIFIFAVFFVIITFSEVHADNRLEIINSTGMTIYDIRCTSVQNPDWGKDLLGNNKLLNTGGKFTINIPASIRYYDLRINFRGYNTISWEKIGATSVWRLNLYRKNGKVLGKWN